MKQSNQYIDTSWRAEQNAGVLHGGLLKSWWPDMSIQYEELAITA